MVSIGTSEGDVFRLQLGEDGTYFPYIGLQGLATGLLFARTFGWIVGRLQTQGMGRPWVP